MFAPSINPTDFIRMAFVAALLLLLFLVDVAAAGAVSVSQLYPVALLPLCGTRSRVVLAAFGLCAAMLIVAAGLPLSWPDQGAAFATRALSVGLVALVAVGLARISGREHELVRLALVDPLTGVFNRRSFIEFASKEEARTRRGGHQFAVLMLDIDHFKRINDRFGHPAGDAVIKALADVCARTLRPSDIIARYGGEEFVINLPATDHRQARLVAERLRQAVAAARVPSEHGAIDFTVSIGLATCSEEMPLGEAIGRADKALYRAKRDGRNRVEATSEHAPSELAAPRAAHADVPVTANQVVLVVDDEAEIRELVGEWLISHGYAVRTAEGAAQALRLLETDPGIELIFTDIVMPGGLDGFDLGRQAALIRPDIKLLYMSGFAASAVARAARGQSARIVHKPFRLDHVLESVQYALQH